MKAEPVVKWLQSVFFLKQDVLIDEAENAIMDGEHADRQNTDRYFLMLYIEEIKMIKTHQPKKMC